MLCQTISERPRGRLLIKKTFSIQIVNTSSGLGGEISSRHYILCFPNSTTSRSLGTHCELVPLATVKQLFKQDNNNPQPKGSDLGTVQMLPWAKEAASSSRPKNIEFGKSTLVKIAVGGFSNRFYGIQDIYIRPPLLGPARH